tara:strand:+ start:1311 stop:1586 length:276 start_codon:yes stop_codon:yes gene_type:complete
MNGRKTKLIRKQTLNILYLWVKSLVPKEESDKMKPEEVFKMLPVETHIFSNGQLRLSAFSFKWINKKIKKFHLLNKNKKISEIVLSDIHNG